MPPRRPVSPVTLESHMPPASDIAADSLLGSDDELDESARAAKRRRIEKLAEAYLQGTPLFILSASLRGPFENGWVNPWRKQRKRNSYPEANTKARRKEAKPSDNVVIQETIPRKLRHDDILQKRPEGSEPRIESPATKVKRSVRSTKSPAQISSASHDRSPRDEHVQVPASTGCGLRRTIPWAKETPLKSDLSQSSVVKQSDTNWLKTDRKQTVFRNFDPPTSPTTAVSTRHLDAKESEKSKAHVKRVSLTPARKSVARVTPSPIDNSMYLRRAESTTVDRTPLSVKASSIDKQRMPHPRLVEPSSDATQGESSLYIVSSTSQLPKFEYRRPRHHRSGENSPTIPTNTAQYGNETVNRSRSAEPVKEADALEQNPSSKSSTHNPEAPEAEDGHGDQPALEEAPLKISKSGSFLGKGKTVSYADQETTIENLPSGQGQPGNLGLSGYMTSLHSTALPKENDDQADTIPDPQLSTQAALLLAQRSFQDDLESPDRGLQTPSMNQRRGSQRGMRSSPHSNNITPFHQLNNTPHRAGPDDRSKVAVSSKYQMMSTQYMIDAATPYTFSTAKKPSARVGTTSSREKYHRTSFAMSSSPSPRNQTPSSQERADFDPVTSHVDPTEDNGVDAHTMICNDQDAESQWTALPFTLSGSTPPTAQDGQGGNGGVDSFNLSQAIADAGSWLQQSFDFNKDLKQYSGKVPTSSAEAGRSALSLDTMN